LGHRFFHPDQLLEPLGQGWVMLHLDDTLGAVVPMGNGYFRAFKKQGDNAEPVPGRATSRARAAVLLWNATHAMRWGDRD
jgi:hypothetical protein